MSSVRLLQFARGFDRRRQRRPTYLSNYQYRQFSDQDSQKLCFKYANFLSSVKSNGKDEDGKVTHQYMLDNKVCEIIIDNPSKRNSINGKMMGDIARIFDEILLEKKRKPLAVIIRGAGNFFCSGADLSLSLNEVNTPEKGLQMSHFMTDALNSLRASDILSVSLLNGPALGGGAELATTCDWRIVDSRAYIQFVHARIGASPGWGGGGRLLHIVGRQHALRLLATSERIKAQEMLKIGLADHVIEPTAEKESDATALSHYYLQSVLDYLKPYMEQPYESSVKGIKSIIAASERSEGDMAEVEKQIFLHQWASDDNKHGISTFLSRKSK